MDNDAIDCSGFEPFFTEADTLRQHCHLLETELAELHSELKESRGKIATLVLMWSGVTRDLAITESELRETKWALEVAKEQTAEKAEAIAPEQTGEQPAPGLFALE